MRSATAAYMLDFAAIWQAADKIVYSTTLTNVSTARTRIERSFDPAGIRRMKTTAQRDITVAGPSLAAHAFAAGVVDVCHVFVAPIAVGGGTRSLPSDIVWSSTCSTSAVSTTAWPTSTTAPGRDVRALGRTR